MPQVVKFTNFEIDASELKRAKLCPYPFPKGWARLKVEFAQFGAIDKLVNWVLLNIPGRFGYVHVYPNVVLYFEDPSDGILFKMLEGETACLEA